MLENFVARPTCFILAINAFKLKKQRPSTNLTHNRSYNKHRPPHTMGATRTKHKSHTQWELQGPNTNPTQTIGTTRTKHKPNTQWELRRPNTNPTHNGSYKDQTQTHHTMGATRPKN